MEATAAAWSTTKLLPLLLDKSLPPSLPTCDQWNVHYKLQNFPIVKQTLPLHMKEQCGSGPCLSEQDLPQPVNQGCDQEQAGNAEHNYKPPQSLNLVKLCSKSY